MCDASSLKEIVKNYYVQNGNCGCAHLPRLIEFGEIRLAIYVCVLPGAHNQSVSPQSLQNHWAK